MPYFKDMRGAPVGENIKFKEYTDIFDVPDTPEELMELVLRRLKSPVVPAEVMEKRRALFAELVSTLDGNAAAQYVDLLRSVVAKGTPLKDGIVIAETIRAGLVSP